MNTQPAGVMAIRTLRATAIGRKDDLSAHSFAVAKGWTDVADHFRNAHTKAAVPTISSNTAPLIDAVGSDFLAALRPSTLLGRLGIGRVPSRTRLLTHDTGFRGYWFAEGKPLPMSPGGFDVQNLDRRKVGALTVASNELVRSDLLDVEKALLADLLAACREAADRALIDPANGGEPGERPASLTHPSSGGVVLTSSGATTSAIDNDLKAAAQALITAGSSLQGAQWVMHPALALKMSLMRGSGGQLIYPGLHLGGGVLAGLPVLTTAGAPANIISLVDPAQASYSEDQPLFVVSQEAMIDVNSLPGEEKAVTPMSCYQTDSTVLMVVLYLNFLARRTAAASITGVSL